MKSIAAAFLLITPFCVLAQAPSASTDQVSPRVTVTSRGNDVRLILTTMFSQAKKSFILQPNIEFNLYLSMQDADFQKALDVICTQANLKYDVRDDIYHIFKRKPIVEPSAQTIKPKDDMNPFPTEPLNPSQPALSTTKSGRLSISVFKKKVTTKLTKAPIGAVLEELGNQAGVKIELGENVPAYKLDAFLNNTTLRYALEQVTRAAKLTYSLTDHHTILVDARS